MFSRFCGAKRKAARAACGGPPPRRPRPRLESLEDRLLLSASSLVYPGPDGHLIYAPDAQGNTIPDFSTVGYRSGVVPLPGTGGAPAVPVKAVVTPPAGGADAGATIQAAIDLVSKLPLDANGFRGAVLLQAGEYRIGGHLTISTSGVVLRGEGSGPGGTVLRATGTGRRYQEHLPLNDGLVQLVGAVPGGAAWTGSDDFASLAVAGTQHNLTDNYVPVGARSFHVDGTAGLHVGDSVIVERPSTAAWLHAIGMDGPQNPWLPGTKDLFSDRVITQIDAQHNLVTVDAPLTDALEQKYGGGTIFKYSFPGRIDHVGVENLSGVSDFDRKVIDAGKHFVDEKHAWTFISLAGVENAWVRQITAEAFAFSAVDVQKMSKWVTVEDCQNLDPVSLITGGHRYSFEVGGQLTLVEDCYARHGRHDFVLHETVPGPNVFVNCKADQAYDESGPHHRWDTGVLYDNVVVHGTTDPGFRTAGSLEAHNQGMVDGHGWSGANILFWNCTADKIDVGKPPTAQNWAIGDTTTVAPAPTGTGFIESSNKPVEPHSLYAAQLADRLARFRPVSGLVRVTATPVPGQGQNWFVRVTNISNEPIPGPVLIAFATLPPVVGPGPANGTTAANDLFVVGGVPGLAAGESATAIVSFTGPPSLLSRGVVVEALAELPPPHVGPAAAPATLAGAVPPSSPLALDSLFAGPAAAP
jgi:hypothetical protein